jgi:recombination protein RecA
MRRLQGVVTARQYVLLDYDIPVVSVDKAIIISKAMRKITNLIGRQKITLVFTNQLRQKMNAMPFSDPWTTSGGKAIAFHASVRLRLKSMGTIKAKDGSGNERIVGIKVRCQVVKNRMGPPLRSADFDIFFDRGIDNYGAWLGSMKENAIVKQSGAWYEYIDIDSGEVIKFQAKDFPLTLDSNPGVREQIYKRICEATILRYKKDSLDTDNLVVDSEVIGD